MQTFVDGKQIWREKNKLACASISFYYANRTVAAFLTD